MDDELPTVFGTGFPWQCKHDTNTRGMFVLDTASRAYALRAETNDEADKWVAALRTSGRCFPKIQ